MEAEPTPNGQNTEKPDASSLADRPELRKFLEEAPAMDFAKFRLKRHDWISIYEDILWELTEEDLRTFWRFYAEEYEEILLKSQKKTGRKGRPVPVPKPDLTALFANLKDNLDRHPKPGQLAAPHEAMVKCYSGLAKAIRNGKQDYLGRLVTAWFQDFRPHHCCPWAEKYCKFIQRDPDFIADVLRLRKLWPNEVFLVFNTAIPQSRGAVVDPGQPLVGRNAEVYPGGERFDYTANKKFITRARQFLRRWHLQLVNFSRNSTSVRYSPGKRYSNKSFIPVPGGYVAVIAAEPWFASDVNGYGTYIYVPPFYNWSTLRNDTHVDYEPLTELLDRTYKPFSPVAREPDEGPEECLQHVLWKIDRKQWTEEQVKKLVSDWCGELVKTKIVNDKWTGTEFTKKKVPAPRYGDRITIEKYENYVLDELPKIIW
jgi:hypothetical protein